LLSWELYLDRGEDHVHIIFMSAGLDEKIKFLKAQGAETQDYSGRPLLEHLRGTHDLLKAWHRRSTVCDAGLFHSVYGTEHFAPVTLESSLQFLVKKLIGEEAERLVWIFAVLDRESFDKNIPKKNGYSVVDRTNGKTIPLSSTEWLDLVDITFANTLEAMPHISWFLRRNCRKYLKQFGFVTPPPAKEALSRF
jgi:hypothetical protein